MPLASQRNVDRHLARLPGHLQPGSRASASACRYDSAQGRSATASRHRSRHLGVHTRYFDLDGRIGKMEPSAIVDPTQYGFNTVSSIDSSIRLIGTAPDASRSIGYGYDLLDRLARQTPNVANTSAATLSFTLGAIGNRGSSDTGGFTTPSRRNQTLVIGYGGNNRPISYTAAGSTTYVGINALGQRVKKIAGTLTTHFVYNEAGQLIGEYESSGNHMEHVWLDGVPIAAIRSKAGVGGSEMFYVHADHLGTPRAITSTTGYGTVWTWDNNDPFGDNAPNERASTVAGALPFKYNLRFPGQYYDQETGLSYNYYRDYDPATGRYIQSDPIRLAGGLNTYAYVEGSPLLRSDPSGLEAYLVGHLAAGLFGRSTNPNSYHFAISLEPSSDCTCQGFQRKTLGAQAKNGKLTRAVDYPGDNPSRATVRIEIPTPAGQTECEFLADLFSAAMRYGNNLPYTFPNISLLPGTPDGQLTNGFNSNSFAAGVIQAAGGIPPQLRNPNYQAPGYSNPIPKP